MDNIEVKMIGKPRRERLTLWPVEGLIYLVKCDDLYKIGRSGTYMKERMQSLRMMVRLLTGEDKQIELIHTIHTPDYEYDEWVMQQRFATKHVGHEWFELEPADIEAIKAVETF